MCDITRSNGQENCNLSKKLLVSNLFFSKKIESLSGCVMRPHVMIVITDQLPTVNILIHYNECHIYVCTIRGYFKGRPDKLMKLGTKSNEIKSENPRC